MLHFPDNSSRRQLGMSLPELMIAMTLGLLIMAGMATLFVESRRNFGQDELVARMQEDSRFALSELSRELSMAGFWGPMVAGTLLGNDASADPSSSDVFAFYDDPVLSADNIGHRTWRMRAPAAMSCQSAESWARKHLTQARLPWPSWAWPMPKPRWMPTVITCKPMARWA